MISKEDIKKLADLARIEMKEKELDELADEMDAILDYVGEVKEMASKHKEGVDFGLVYNVFREDENPNESASFSKEIIAEFPEKEENYLKVKKIL